jgi:hypothetical protein
LNIGATGGSLVKSTVFRNSMQVTTRAFPGTSLEIEKSSDLKEWTAAASLPSDGFTLDHTVLLPRSEKRQFLRPKRNQ